MGWALFSAQEGPPFYRLFQVFPTGQSAAERLGRAGAVCPARLSRLGSRITLAAWICNSPAATNVLLAGQEVVAMERIMTAYWDEDRQIGRASCRGRVRV